ncbi:MAG TPA: hypothetical protein DCZ94_05735 [Lentisphaeria bacterium]|nr:MAG: hypothetical protein A2X48_07255 [Lentisphaerae bacterium GWF2_49_21]HBC86436.1 hypothetical protein [Lentisphaeria bacterium]
MERKDEIAELDARSKELESRNREQPRYSSQEPTRPAPVVPREGTCIHCGKKTASYWYCDGATGECECKECKTPEKI